MRVLRGRGIVGVVILVSDKEDWKTKHIQNKQDFWEK